MPIIAEQSDGEHGVCNDIVSRRCKMCASRQKDWDGADPICAFETDWERNWNCATLNGIRDIAWEGHARTPPGVLYQFCEDQKYATIRVDNVLQFSEDDGHPACLWLSWHKNRGSTDEMWLLFMDGVPRRPTESELLEVIEHFSAYLGG